MNNVSEVVSLERRSQRLCREVESLTKCGGTEVALITGCNPKDFKGVVSRLSDEKQTVIEEMGFGRVHQFRCSKLNLSLCKTLLQNFNVDCGTINIHGRILSITENDFDRLMGLRCRGIEVDIEALNDDVDVNELKTQLFGDDKHISVDRLRMTIVGRDDADGMFRVSFALFALATLFCPTRPGYVDPRLMLPLRNPYAIKTHNWARFAFTKLVEGVKSYQEESGGNIGGCLIFLQLFYLSVIGQRLFIIPRNVPVVMTWGGDESKKLFETVEKLGGFNTTQGIWDNRPTSIYSSAGSTDYYGTEDYTSGVNRNMVDYMFEVKSDMFSVQDGIGKLGSTVHRLGPDVVDHEADCDPHTDAADMNYFGMKDAVMQEDSLDNLTVPVAAQVDSLGDSLHGNKLLGSRLCSTVPDISDKEGDLLNFILSSKVRAEDISASDEVGRYIDFIVSRWDVRCLCPRHCIRSEVINIMGSYCFANSSDCWFLPTYFSECAQAIVSATTVEAHISSTVTLCRLRNLKGRLHACKKIFIPINDDVADHWFLAVANISESDCEIWDSTPADTAQQRRLDYVNCTMDLLKIVFDGELRYCPLLSSKSGSYCFTFPEENPTQSNKYDSGIFVIRNMQHYRLPWYEGFNSGDQRVRLALEIVCNPLNECRDAIWESVAIDVCNRGKHIFKQPVATGCPVDYDAVRKMPISGIRFKPRVARR